MTAYRLRLSAPARSDIQEILEWTQRQWGEGARLNYQALLATALRDLAHDPERAGVKPRTELGRGLMTYHLHNSRKNVRPPASAVGQPRHLIIFRVRSGRIEVGRVLHDAMDLPRHLPAA